jgi:Spy/CpxP family protein refolding chaperone
MKGLLGKRILAASLGVLVSLSATSWAMGYRGGMDHDPGRMLSHMAERLELSDAQQDQVRTIIDDGREQSVADRERLEALRAELKGMRDNFDPGQAQKIADEIGEITGRMVYQASSSYAEFYSLLNDDQKAELEQLQEERGERRGKWREKFREHQN